MKRSATKRNVIETNAIGVRHRLEQLLSVNPAIIYTTEASGNYACTFVSENLHAIMGYAPEEMTADLKHWPERLHPEDTQRVFDEVIALVERGGGTLEYRFRHRDGHYVWIQDTFKVIHDDAGHPLELVGAWANISERKRAEAQLLETKQYLARLIESTTDAIIATDKEGNVVLLNAGAANLLDYRAEEIIGRHVSVLYGGEAGVKEIMREMRKRGGAISGLESGLWAKDGSRIPVLISSSVLHDEDGQECGTVAINKDLRERKSAEQRLQRAHDELEKRVEERISELRTHRERLQYLMKVSSGVLYTTNALGNYACTYVSENVDLVMGYAPWEMLEDPEFWSSRLHPEDAKRVFNELFPLIGKGGGSLQYRFRHRGGNYLWVQDTFKVMHDDAGRPLEIVGSWADISNLKRAEQVMSERLATMQNLQELVAASPSVVYTTQVMGSLACTFVSDNLKSLMEYAPWEMRDDPKFWQKHLHPDDVPRVLAEINRLIAAGGGAVEYRFRHRRGNYIWIQDSFAVRHDLEGKPKEIVGSWADISDRKRAEVELERLAGEVERRNRFIRNTFGRYLTDEVVATLLDLPAGLQLGGEKRKITMMLTDLRGFTSLSERLAPERVVAILNGYLATMVKIVKQYEGTIDEFIGDAIFVLFGAPIWKEDDAQRAVACAVQMQLAMAAVNEQNREDNLPEIEMGIGLHTGPVVVGNIGSSERMKYGVVGSHVNLTSRIQSHTLGGQILVSEVTRREVGAILKIGKQMEVQAKGFQQPVTVCEVLGIGGEHRLTLPDIAEILVPLAQEVPLRYAIVVEGRVGKEMFKGSLTRLSAKGAEARLQNPVPTLSNLDMHLMSALGEEVHGTLYSKVLGAVPGGNGCMSIRFTSMSPEVETFLRGFRVKSNADVATSEDGNREPMPAEQGKVPAAAGHGRGTRRKMGRRAPRA